MDKSYLEIKVTFLHIVILLGGVIVIGIFLFYLGYQAGKSSMQNQAVRAQLSKQESGAREIRLYDDAQKKPGKAKNDKKSSIQEEMKLHQQPINKRTSSETKVKEKTLTRKSYYTIQVGAFSVFSNAKNYAQKFGKMGYPTEIISTIKKSRKLYRVRVGQFPTIEKARVEKTKLEKMEKKKFAIQKSG